MVRKPIKLRKGRTYLKDLQEFLHNSIEIGRKKLDGVFWSVRAELWKK